MKTPSRLEAVSKPMAKRSGVAQASRLCVKTREIPSTGETQVPPKMLLKPPLGFYCAACCLSLLMSVVLLTTGCSSDESSGDETADSGAKTPVSVQAAKVERVTLYPTLELVGTIIAIPERTAVVSPQIAGWVRELPVVEGQSVGAGDPLVELDQKLAQTAMNRASAVVAEKAAVLSRLKRGYLPQEIAGARQDADQAAATVDGLRNELTALKELLDRGEFSAVVY